MKKIYIALFALLAVGSTFTACTEEEPFATVTEMMIRISLPQYSLTGRTANWYIRQHQPGCELIHRADRDSERLHHSNLVH